MEPELSNVLSLVIQQSQAVSTFWNLYIVVSLGVLGFAAGSRSIAQNPKIKLLTGVIFVVFALSNLGAMTDAQKQRIALAKAAQIQLNSNPNRPGQIKALGDIFTPISVERIRLFHLGLDGLILAMILFIPSRKKPKNRTP